MARVKRGTTKNKKRKNILAQTKGFRNSQKSKLRRAKEALAHAGQNAFNDRRKKKGDFRQLWQARISAALKPHEISYSKFIKSLKDKNIELDRKILATVAKDEPEVFDKIVEQVK